MLDRFLYGVCYYPEHWNPKRHPTDIRRIAKAGFDYIRIAEGAWAYFEPQEGQYQFHLFDRVIDLCRKYRLQIIMGTPTYCGPAWIAQKYPEVLRWNFQRVPMAHGSRRNFNYTSPKYIDLSDRLVTALARHYQHEKQIMGWQLDNEFNCHMDVSYAPSDTQAFQQWLKDKYKTLEALNRAWGTVFWSQTYDTWDQIDLPHPTATYQNPSVLLDESRFISDCVVRFAKRQSQILRKHNPRWRITHNGLFSNINGVELVKQLDFFSHDQYPLFSKSGDWASPAMALQQARALSFPFGILEQQSGPGGQMEYLQTTPRPGQLRSWAWQSVAHGAAFLSYFRWRTCPYGSEQHWHGLLDADDRLGRRLAEAKQTGKEFKSLPREFFAAAPVKTIAVMRDFDNEINDRRINTYNASGQGESWRWLRECLLQHLPADMVWDSSNLHPYRMVILPHVKIVTPGLIKKLQQFVAAGGTLVLGAQSGAKDLNCHIVEMPLPGLLGDLCGLTVADWTTLPEKETRQVKMADGMQISLGTFVEKLQPQKAQILATWSTHDSLLAGAPAITLNKVGRGQVIYIGGYLQQEAIHDLLPWLCSQLGIGPLAGASTQVEVLLRQNTRKQWYVILNHSSGSQRVAGLPKGRHQLDGQLADNGDWILPAYGVALIECAQR